jgi:putative FmdB family regulatory protein
MPIYEFFCAACNTVFSFFSATVNTEARPACPRCARPRLERRPSRFTARRGGARPESDEADEPSPFGDVDESRLESAMDSLAREMEGLSDDDAENPRQLARFFRRFGEASGLEPGPRMEEMLRRLDAGESPDDLEDEFGSGEENAADEDFSEFFRLKKQAQAARARRPRVDETLYFL